jgi:hypothetical protein
VIEARDTEARFILAGPDTLVSDHEHRLATLRDSWDRENQRQHVNDATWHSDLAQYLTDLVDLRVAHVESWLESNLQQFESGHASIEELRRTFGDAVIDLRASIELCRSKCGSCNLICVRSGRLHGDVHNCLTNHKCIHVCTFCERDGLSTQPCGQTYVRPNLLSTILTRCNFPAQVIQEITCEFKVRHAHWNFYAHHNRCQVGIHLCGELCAHSGRRGCTERCVKVISFV